MKKKSKLTEKATIGLEPGFIESYVSGIEKYLKVKQKDRILKGETDNLFGNIIIEFEANILKKRSEAEGQLRRYVAILWSQEPFHKRTPYLCLATDGVRFVTYSPTLAELGNIKSIGKLRSMVRQMLNQELAEIDELTKKILG